MVSLPDNNFFCISRTLFSVCSSWRKRWCNIFQQLKTYNSYAYRWTCWDFIIFHGVGGHPDENWFPWLKEQLEPLNFNVIIPQFPTPENQTLENWLKVMEKYKDQLNKDTILIGHSLGVPFALNIIEKHQVKAAFLVAGFTGKVENEFDEGMKTFAQRQFNWQKIKANCKDFYIFHSDNDPYIKLDKAEELAKNFNTKVELIKGGGHLNQSAGYWTFDLLLDKIKANKK